MQWKTFQEYMQAIHARNYRWNDDDMSDDYTDFVIDLTSVEKFAELDNYIELQIDDNVKNKDYEEISKFLYDVDAFFNSRC